MRKNKLLAISLVMTLAIGTAGCGNKDVISNTSESETKVVESSETVVITESVSISENSETLETETKSDKMVITIGVQNNASILDWEDNLLTNAIEGQFDVECEFVIMPVFSGRNWIEVLTLYSPEAYGEVDMIIGPSGMTKSTIANLVEAEIITPIEAYVLDAEKTPYFNALQENIKEECLKVMKYEDGHMYGFPDYVDNPESNNPERLWINKAWLEKLDLEVPETTEELKEVLIAFCDGDPNGNGIPDEIGIYGKRHGYGQDVIACLMNSFLENSWNNGKMNSGLALDQQTGETVVAPFVTEGWKEGLKYLNDLYEEGVLAPSIFTDDEPTYKDILNRNSVIVGLTDMQYNTTIMDEEIRAQYTYLVPLTGWDGYSWFPTRSSAFDLEVLFTCEGEKLEKCIAIQDAMYDFSTPDSLGIIRQGRGVYGVDWTDDPEVLKTTSNIYVEAGLIDSLSYARLTKQPSQHNWNWGGYGAGTPENGICWNQGANLYEGVYDINTAEDAWMLEFLKALDDSKYVPKTLPILNYTQAELEILNKTAIRSNVVSCVNTFLEECITGVQDVETSWDAYLAELESLGLNEWLEIAQQAYDRQK